MYLCIFVNIFLYEKSHSIFEKKLSNINDTYLIKLTYIFMEKNFILLNFIDPLFMIKEFLKIQFIILNLPLLLTLLTFDIRFE